MEKVNVRQAATIISEAGFPIEAQAVTKLIQRGRLEAVKEPVKPWHKTKQYVITMDELNRHIAARKLAAGMPLKELLGEVSR
ncbi:hypothetical protein bcgnr5379_59470 [Bacillus cereus]